MSNCLNCGKKTDRKKYCDLSCLQAFRSRSHRQYTKHRKSACEKCGRKTTLHVHHLDENPSNNDPANLITLCKAHHEQIHAFGRLSKSPYKQANEYLNQRVKRTVIERLRKYEQENGLKGSISSTIEHLLNRDEEKDAWAEIERDL